MPQVSRRPLNKFLEQRMHEVFWGSLAKLNSKVAVSGFLSDLLTPTERVMLAKRLAMAILIERGWCQDEISHALKVSTATIVRLKSTLRYGGQGYRAVIDQLGKDEAWADLLNGLEKDWDEFTAGQIGRNWKQSKSEVFQKHLRKRLKRSVL